MPNKFITIKLDNTKIDLTNSSSLSYDKTNLPKQAFSFKTERPIFWKLMQHDYDLTSGTLLVSVIDYNASAEDMQNDVGYQINKLNFDKLDWTKFESQIFSYRLGQLKNSISNYRNKLLDLRDEENEHVRQLKRTAPNIFFESRQQAIEELEIEEKVRYEDARFDASKIVFTINVKRYKITKQVEIDNINLRPEFEYVKPYFVKRLGKYFMATVKVKLLDGKLEEIAASSDDIKSITEELVNTIRTDATLDLRHLKAKRINKMLYTAKDLSSEADNGTLLSTSANDILETFINNGEVRNVRQLEYLSRDKHSLNERLQFTIKPLFGFVFHESGHQQRFIWELLNSHATYIWKKNDTEVELDLSRVVEQAITTIKNQGRDAYKRYYKTIENPGYDFGIIDHQSSNLTNDERFNEWKRKLEKFCS